jgi:hypothetical protein
MMFGNIQEVLVILPDIHDSMKVIWNDNFLGAISYCKWTNPLKPSGNCMTTFFKNQ